MTSPVAMVAAGTGAGGVPMGTRTKLERAYLQLYEPSPDGSLAKPGPPLDRLEFQFNPRELTLDKAATWARQTGKGNQRSGAPQYTGPQPSKLVLEMFFDASRRHDGGVVEAVETLFRCCVPTTATHQQRKGSPPWVLFRWGSLTGFLAYVQSVQARYTLFTSAGLPIRAACTVTLEEIAGDAPRQNPTSGGPVPRRLHLVHDGDTLAGIAYREYGDPGLWRAVARVNGIDDPTRLRPGTSVLLPAVDELRRPAAPEPAAPEPAARPGQVARAVR